MRVKNELRRLSTMRLFLPISGNKRYRELCEAHPKSLGYIIGPSYYQRPKPGIDFVLDNDAFKCWKEKREFDAAAWMKMIGKIERSGMFPRWVVVPDVVCDRDGTLRNWERHSPLVANFPRAFVLQDGIKLSDLPEAEVYFVGGSTQFKWSTAHFWCKHLSRVHVGRVRSRRLYHCERIGAESCDGSGWLRESVLGRPFRQLEAWLEGCNFQYEFPAV